MGAATFLLLHGILLALAERSRRRLLNPHAVHVATSTLPMAKSAGWAFTVSAVTPSGRIRFHHDNAAMTHLTRVVTLLVTLRADLNLAVRTEPVFSNLGGAFSLGPFAHRRRRFLRSINMPRRCLWRTLPVRPARSRCLALPFFAERRFRRFIVLLSPIDQPLPPSPSRPIFVDVLSPSGRPFEPVPTPTVMSRWLPAAARFPLVQLRVFHDRVRRTSDKSSRCASPKTASKRQPDVVAQFTMVPRRAREHRRRIAKT